MKRKTILIPFIVFIMLIPLISQAAPIPDTGQTKYYNDSDEIPCPSEGQAFYGQDANYTINPPSYTKLDAQGNDLADNAPSWVMVRDNVTGLIWEVKTNRDGTKDYSDPHDADNTYTWYDSNPATNGGNAGTQGNGTDTEDFINALNAANFGGHSDWRMPSINELRSIVDYRGGYPAINTDYFPNTVASFYWSSTTSAYSTYYAFYMYFDDGHDGYYDKYDNFFVRAVRGGQSGSFDNFVINGDGTVTDKATGLMWQQATAPGTYTWSQALSYCENLSLTGYSDWRLPTEKELGSIVDLTRYNPSINTNYFTNTVTSGYWSSTTYAYGYYTYRAWSMHFYYGYDSESYKSSSYYVLAVRGGQSGPLGHLVILSPGQASFWHIGDVMPITWDTSVFSGDVIISISLDGGKTFQEIIVTTNDGEYAWTVTGSESVNCVLKITQANDQSKMATEGLFSMAFPTGFLTVATEPQGAIDAGAQWKVDNGDWHGSGATVSVPIGSHTVEYKAVEGWDTPANQTVTIENGHTTNAAGTYVRQTGSLTVTINTQGAIDVGAKWRRVGTEIWHDSGDTETGLPTGKYILKFKAAFGYYMPGNQTVTITKNAVNELIIIYHPTTGPSGGVPDTGQTKCYNAYREIPCPAVGQAFYGQDENYTINPPSYTKLDANGNDLPDNAPSWVMVRDNVTGLIWEMKTDDGTIHDKDNTYTWCDSDPETNGGNAGTCGDGTDTEDFINALNTANFGGYQDWRMPTINELQSVVDYGRYNPAINTDYFPNTVVTVGPGYGLGYWSSTTCAGLTDHVWYYGFLNCGGRGDYGKDGKLYVRAVRGGQSGSLDNLVINGDDTVTDTTTGLMWQQTTALETYTWAQALSYCENLSLAGYSDWRLPTVKEISSIVDYTQDGPAANINFFPDIMFDYWSSTTDAGDTGSALDVGFAHGGDDYDPKSRDYYVRAVRGGQNLLLDHLIITAPRQADRWNIGSEKEISWDTKNIPGNVKISLSRQGGKDGTFEIIAASTENDGNYAWTVTLPESVNCVLKIEPINNPENGSSQGLFSIYSTEVVALITNAPNDPNNNKSYTLNVGGVDVTAYKYKLDNDPSWSTEYSIETPLTFTLSNEGPHILYVVGKDSLGKWQTEQNATTVSWTADFTSPTVNITSPEDNSEVGQINMINATASDAVSGISSMEFQVTDGFWFVHVNEISEVATLTPVETWIKAKETSSNSWYITSNNFPWEFGKNYTITARAVDKAGNVARDSVYVAYHDVNNNPAWTTLFLDLSSQTILNGGKIEVSGKLTRLPAGDPPVSLSGLNIILTITDPDQISSRQTVSTYDSAGHFELTGASAISGFTKKGVYTIQASFAGNSGLYKAESVKKAVLVGAQAGYAVIVEGKVPVGEGLLSHNKTANRVYDRLIDRGFLPDNIYYFNYNTAQNGVDDAPTKAEVQNKIETWVPPKMNGSPAPLYIIFIDHGNRNAFRLNDETISPTDLNNWLTTMEGNLTPAALLEHRIIIMGACYSGSFIPELSTEGRIVVASAAGDEESYKGPQEPDGIRSGEFFLEELFEQLWRGQSLKNSFEYAVKQTRLYTRKGSANANSSNPYFDQSMQHPLLDDNGDNHGSNLLSEGYGDGQASAGIYLGTGLTYNTNSAENPAEILSVTPTQYLDSSTSSALLWAKTNGQEGSAWYEVRSPSKVLNAEGGSGQLEIDLDKQLMTHVSGQWEKEYSSFSESGKYEVFYFVRDAITDEVSPMKRSVVYKAKDGNHPPGSFSLLAPLDINQPNYKDPKTVLIFDWEDAPDPDPGDAVTYNLIIASDSQFAHEVIRKEEITSPFACLNYTDGLKDLTPYYWKVEAVDSYGAKTSSSVWSFKTNNTNEFAGFITGRVYSGSNYNPIQDAKLEASLGNAHAASFADGTYIMLVPAGTASVYGTKQGFSDVAITGIHVNEGVVTKVDVMMQPEGLPPDTTAPISHASPADGTYTSAVELTLTCDDGEGSGCSAIHYTLDSSEPTSDSPTYSAPIRLIKTTTLKFYAKDNAGNAELVHTQTYTIQAIKGDLNSDGDVNLEDAIVALQVLTGIGNDDMNKDAEINNDGRIGLEEVIYILQDISGLR